MGKTGIFGVIGVLRVRLWRRWDWARVLAELRMRPDFEDVQHVVIVPNYKEDEEVLRDTCQCLAESPLAREKLTLVLAMEDREGEAAREKANALLKTFAGRFRG